MDVEKDFAVSSKPLIIETGTAPRAIRERFLDLGDWFYLALDKLASDVEIVRPYLNEPLPEPDPTRVTLITGSWAMVTDHEPWSERTAEWIRKAVACDAPLLGVCYGHQLMAYALGGEVAYFPDRKEIGCLPVTLLKEAESDPLLQGLPTQFEAYLTHAQRVTKVPENAQVLATSERDGHQIIRYSPTAVSTQFHPEFTAALLKAVINLNYEKLVIEGQPVEQLIADLKAADVPRTILHRFVHQYQ